MKSNIVAIIEVLEQRNMPLPLFPGQTWNVSLQEQIEALKSFGSSTERITLIAALHLRNESLNLSHSYAQQIEHDATGAYWHGMMHRMAGDYSNARYWFWQAGQHPVISQVQLRVANWLQQHWNGQMEEPRINDILQSFQRGGWNSVQFIELLQLSSILQEESVRLLECIQAQEIEVLFQYTLEAIDD